MQKRVKKLFIPHEENNYQPDILQKVSLGVMVGMVLFSFALANLQSFLWMASDWMVSTVLPSVLIELTNEERADASLGTLHINGKLTEAANLKAQDMAKNGYFAHYSPTGVSPWHWFDEVSYNYIHAGENLAVHFTESDEVVAAWMDSPTHRANILNGNYTEIGIGTAKGEYKGFPTVFVVQLFGTPAAVPQVLAEADTVPAAETPVVTLETERQNTVDDTTEDTVAPISFETIEITELATENSENSEEIAESSTTEAVIVEETTLEDVVVIELEHVSSTRDGVPAVVAPADGEGTGGSGSVNIFEKGALIPSIWLQVFYGLLAVFVIGAATLSVFIEWQRQHPIQIAYGTGLVMLMLLLYSIHTVLTSGATIV